MLRISTRLTYYVCALLLLLGTRVRGQAPKPDSSSATSTSSALYQRYAAGLGHEARLYNGMEYVNYLRPFVKGHQYFGSADPQEGSIDYDGAHYAGVPLRYDMIRGQVVLKAPQGLLTMQLIPEKVSGFRIGNHAFVRVVAPAGESPIPTGFYELLVDGPVRLLAARRKTLHQQSTPSGMQGETTQKDEYIVYKDDSYHEVSTAATVLKLFPENKAAIRKYGSAKKLKFSKTTRENSLVELVRYAATLPAPAQPSK